MRWLFMILAALLLVSCGKQSYVAISSGKESVKVNVELARTQEEITTGLMYRTELDKNSGMLFIFEDEAPRVFWMKNTLIPLDMIFIAENGTIVGIQHAVPCKTAECELYPSVYPAKYVLEVNGNFTKKNNIEVGGAVNIPFNTARN